MPHNYKTLIFGGYFYLTLLVVKTKIYDTAKYSFDFSYTIITKNHLVCLNLEESTS